MRETNIMDNYNCKTQAYEKVCEENEYELEKNDAYCCGKSCKFERSYRKSGEMYRDYILKDDLP